MRMWRLAGVAGGLALAFSTIAPVAADAAPRKRAPSSVTAKKAAAAKRAAAAAAKREAEEVAKRAAAAAAEQARLRAQWGLLYELAGRDYEIKGTPVTVRWIDGTDAIEMTQWSPLSRTTHQFRRDPGTGKITHSQTGLSGGASHTVRAASDSAIEMTTRNEVSWPFLKRVEGGEIRLARAPGDKLVLKPIDPVGKGAAKLAKLVEEGKVKPAGAGGAARPAVSLAAVGAVASPVKPAAPMVDTLAFFRSLRGSWTNGQGMWSFTPGDSGTSYDFWTHNGKLSNQVQVQSRDGNVYSGTVKILPIGGGYYFTDVKYAMFPTADGAFEIRLVKLKKNQLVAYQMKTSIIHGPYRRMTDSEVAQWQGKAEQNRLASLRRQQQEQQSRGNSGWLGGLIMGGVAAAAGGDAGMVMGAAMKGVEMTTDNEMTRNVLAGQGDAMIQSSIDLQNQKAELERLRVAAEAEIRRKREAAIAAENARRVADANARQQAIAEANAAKRAADEKAQREQAARTATQNANAARSGGQLASAGQSGTNAGSTGGGGLNCPFISKPGPTPTPCDPGPRVMIYGHFVGISMISRAEAEAQAMADCAKAGKSCHVVEVIGGNGRHWRVEVAYPTGEYRRVSTGASAVSSQ